MFGWMWRLFGWDGGGTSAPPVRAPVTGTHAISPRVTGSMTLAARVTGTHTLEPL